MAYMAEVLGQKAKSAYFAKRAGEISSLINKWMWNQKDGLYYDVDDEGHQVKRKTIACFWPMLAGVADKSQSEELIKNLKDPEKFWRTIVFPTLSADEENYKRKGGYWRGAVWAPTNMAVIKGLEEEGFYEFAYEASVRYLNGMREVFKKTGTVWENYAPDLYSQGKPAKPRFVGWTGCGPIALLIENVIGIQTDAFRKTITWRIHRIDKHGIKNLKFGKITASMIADKRENSNSPVTVRLNADSEFKLILKRDGKTKEITVKEGDNKFTL
jgi:glycogen debranching enzyme